jgi:DNA-binding phage protein
MTEINFKANVLKLLEINGTSLDEEIPAKRAGLSRRELKNIVDRDRPTLKTVNRLAMAWHVHVADLACGPGLGDFRPYNGKPNVADNVNRLLNSRTSAPHSGFRTQTFTEIAVSLGISRQALYRQIYGSPRMSTLEGLAGALGCSVKELLE